MAELVSIVVPCYNGARWLAAALDSALAQTWPELQVIVVDDGSTDDSVEVARSFEGRGVTVLTGPNQGPAAARNRGIEAAEGAHVQLLDADDLLLPRKIELCLAAREGPDDVPFGGLVPFGGSAPSGLRARAARWLRAPDPAFDPTRPIEAALTFEIQTSQPLLPTARLRRIGGFRASLRWLEDIDLTLRMVLDGARYVPVGTPLVLLRDHAEPGRQRLHPGAAEGRIAGEHAMMATVREAGRWSPEVARVFAGRLAYAGRQALIAGHEAVGRGALEEARALDPGARATAVPLYNAVAGRVGVERTERWLRALRG
jgi:hypothetical protein